MSVKLFAWLSILLVHFVNFDQFVSSGAAVFKLIILVPVPGATRSKTWVCGRSPAEIAGSNPTGGMDVCLL